MAAFRHEGVFRHKGVLPRAICIQLALAPAQFTQPRPGRQHPHDMLGRLACDRQVDQTPTLCFALFGLHTLGQRWPSVQELRHLLQNKCSGDAKMHRLNPCWARLVFDAGTQASAFGMYGRGNPPKDLLGPSGSFKRFDDVHHSEDDTKHNNLILT